MKKLTGNGPGSPALPCSSSFVRLFKWQFAHAVEHGKKTQTVRPTPKRMPKPGDSISLRAWTGLPYRSKQRILRDAIVERVEEIHLSENCVTTYKDSGRRIKQVHRDPEAFARLDGFQSWSEMKDWFRDTHGLPFVGILICWKNTHAQPPARVG